MSEWYDCKEACLRAVDKAICLHVEGWTELVSRVDVKQAIERLYQPASQVIPYPIEVRAQDDAFFACVPALGSACTATGNTQTDAVYNLVRVYAVLSYTLAEEGRTLQDIEQQAARRPRRICLCGSTKFKAAYHEWNARLTLEGHVVLSIAVWAHADQLDPTEEQKTLLDRVHKAKIDACDEIFVLDVGGYVGSSTKSEIEWAENSGKPVRYLSKERPEWTEADCRWYRKETLC